MNEKQGTGKGGGLLAHLPEDVKYFRETVRGRTMVMGRRTLESLPGGKPLENRVSMVLFGDETYTPEGIRMHHSVEDMLEALRDHHEEDVFIIGGDMIHKEFLPYCSKAHATYIHRAFDMNAALENLGQNKNWKLGLVSDGKEYEGISLEFRVYRRIR